LNLVENGIKYTRAGGSVTLSLQRREAGWLLRVADTGMGLAEQEQEQIFQPSTARLEALTLSQFRRRAVAQHWRGPSALAHGGSIQVQAHPATEVFLPSAFRQCLTGIFRAGTVW